MDMQRLEGTPNRNRFMFRWRPPVGVAIAQIDPADQADAASQQHDREEQPPHDR
jgi:hypothetical protein